MTYLAVPISGVSVAQAKGQVSAAVAGGAEMLELRTDYLENLSIDLVKSLIGRVRELADSAPLIVTCRDEREGGARPYPLGLRVDVLVAAIKAGAEFVDLECANLADAEGRRVVEALRGSRSTRLILSAHDFEGPFDGIVKLYRDIKRCLDGVIPKIVYTAKHINDCFAAFDLLRETAGEERIVLCMGEAGLISRILAKKLGGLLTFASVAEGAGTAPGQLILAELKELYRHDCIDSETELFGVIADPVGHSMSPVIHNACFADADMNKLYLPLLVGGGKQGFDAFMDNALSRPWLDFRGFSVTIPHKHSALEYVRERGGFVEPLAERIGAANTIVRAEDGSLSAYNTDYAGALDAITSAMGIGRDGLAGMAVAVVGAGGVARAIVAGLADAGAKIRIYNRTAAKAERLAAEFGCEYAPLSDLAGLDAKLVINCTSIGMHPKTGATPVPEECLKPDMAVFDTVYNPAETLLLRLAKDKGAKVIDGISMFVNQAMAQFKLFTGQAGNAELMRKVVCQGLE